MPRRPATLLGTALLLAAAGFSAAVGKDEAPAAKQAREPLPVKAAAPKSPLGISGKPPLSAAAAKPVEKAGDKAKSDQSTPDQPSADETAIRLTGETFAKAYNAADAKATAAHFTPDAEYIDEQGNIFQGREAIQQALAACFAANPGAEMEMNIFSIRFVTPGVAVEDGTTAVTTDDETDIVYTRYTAVHVKTDGQWSTASVREVAPKDRRQHRAQLQQLAWLKGDWVDESDDTLVVFSCDAVDGGNFLLRKFTVHIAGQEAMSGTQRIGWDPLTGKLKSWTFDSEGGYCDGFWHRDGDTWELKSAGVTADGQPASSTTIYTLVNEHTMKWQSVDHEIAGVKIPDSEEVTIVRRAPNPELNDDAETSQSR